MTSLDLRLDCFMMNHKTVNAKIKLVNLVVSSDKLVCDLFIQQIVSACVTAATDAGVFSALSEASLSAESIADRLNLDTDTLQSILQTLVAYNFLNKIDSVFLLSDESKLFFVQESPLFKGYSFIYSPTQWHEKILKTLKKEVTVVVVDGFSYQSMWSQGNISQAAASRFTQIMHVNNSAALVTIAQLPVFKAFQWIVDVGAGSGVFLAALRQMYFDKKLTFLDLPPVCDFAKNILNQYIDPETIDYLPGNWFLDTFNFLKIDESQTQSVRAFFLSHILHDWPIETAKKILQKIFLATQQDECVFIFEFILSEDRLSPAHTVAFDVLMKVNHNSHQLTEKQLVNLCHDVGFQSVKSIFNFGYGTLFQIQKI